MAFISSWWISSTSKISFPGYLFLCFENVKIETAEVSLNICIGVWYFRTVWHTVIKCPPPLPACINVSLCMPEVICYISKANKKWRFFPQHLIEMWIKAASDLSPSPVETSYSDQGECGPGQVLLHQNHLLVWTPASIQGASDVLLQVRSNKEPLLIGLWPTTPLKVAAAGELPSLQIFLGSEMGSVTSSRQSLHVQAPEPKANAFPSPGLDFISIPGTRMKVRAEQKRIRTPSGL